MELAPGSRAPAFSLEDLAGRPIAYNPTDARDSTRTRPTLLVFIKSSCPTCRWALPFYDRLHGVLRAAGAKMIVVAEDSPEEIAPLVAGLQPDLTVVCEPEPYAVSAAYGLVTVPTTFWIDAGGIVKASFVGFSRDELADVARRAAEGPGDGTGSAPEALFQDGEEIPAFRPG